ncbi:MAG: hypothetical protein ABII27_04205 [bacterium]
MKIKYALLVRICSILIFVYCSGFAEVINTYGYPYIPHYKNYKYGVAEHKLKTGFYINKLNPDFIQIINEIPESKEQLKTYILVEEQINNWKHIGLGSSLTAVTGALYAINNSDFEKTNIVRKIVILPDGSPVQLDEIQVAEDSTAKNKYKTGLIFGSVGLILALISALVIYRKSSKQDNNLLSAVNIYNDKSIKKIELMVEF